MAGSPSKQRPIGVVLHDLSGGGSERIALRLAHGWQALGRSVVLLCGDPHGPLQGLAEGLPLITPERPIPRGLGSRRRLSRWVAMQADERELGGLFLPGNYHFPLLDGLRFSIGKPPVVLAKLSNTIARQRQFNRLRPFWRGRMARRLRRADAVVAMSPALAGEARSILGPLPLSVVPEPIIDDDFEPPDGTGLRAGLIAAGRFAPQKDFGLLVEAVVTLADPTITLTIAGDGPGLAPLRRRVGKALASQVRLPGRVQDIAPLLRTARVFVLSSRFEGYPAVLIEALANGCRLIATDCSPAIREIIGDPAVGEIVPAGEARALADAMARQLCLAPPPPEAMARAIAEHRLGRAAASYLELFNRP